MASKMIGIEFGGDTMKLAVCGGGVAKEMYVARLPENMIAEGRATAPGALSEFIASVCKQCGIRGGSCAMVLPSEAVIFRRVTMPLMNETELKLNLPFEFRDFVGKEAAKFDYDYSVIRVRDKVMELNAAAVRKDVVESYYDILRKAGLKLKIAIPAEMAWQNLILNSKDEPKKLCILDIGHNNTRVSIYSDGCYEMGRAIPLGGTNIDKAISSAQQIDPYLARNRKEADMEEVASADYCAEVYSQIAVEVMRIVNFYRSAAGEGEALQDLYYCGGSNTIESLRTAVLKRTNLTFHHIRRLVAVDNSIDDDTVLSCALAAGAGMQAL